MPSKAMDDLTASVAVAPDVVTAVEVFVDGVVVELAALKEALAPAVQARLTELQQTLEEYKGRIAKAVLQAAENEEAQP